MAESWKLENRKSFSFPLHTTDSVITRERERERESISMKKKLQILLFLFILNSLSLCLYFTNHHTFHNPSSKPHSSLSLTKNNTLFQQPFQTHFSKPWPILPSYLPWSQTQTPIPLRSCEAYFGNGFTRRLDILPSNGASGWFRCWFSETLMSSICEGGTIRMVPEKILMAKGGESLVEVIGRKEEDELPVFENGAFEIDGGEMKEKKSVVDENFLDQFVPDGEITRHTMRDLISKIQIVGTKDFDCDEVSGTN